MGEHTPVFWERRFAWRQSFRNFFTLVFTHYDPYLTTSWRQVYVTLVWLLTMA